MQVCKNVPCFNNLKMYFVLFVPTNAADSSSGSIMVTGTSGNLDTSKQSRSESISTAQLVLSPPSQLLAQLPEGAQQPSTSHLSLGTQQQPALQMPQGVPQQTIGQLLHVTQQQPSPQQPQGAQQQRSASMHQAAQAHGLVPQAPQQQPTVQLHQQYQQSIHQLHQGAFQQSSVHLHQSAYQQSPVSLLYLSYYNFIVYLKSPYYCSRALVCWKTPRPPSLFPLFTSLSTVCFIL